MGRELQKKKNRSGLNKVRHKPKSKKLNLRSNAIIAANWDKTLSVAQNYKNLGLTAKLNHRTGGTEKHKELYREDAVDEDKDTFAIVGRTPAKFAMEETEVVRDPETGAILRVVGKEKKANPLNDPLNDIEDEYEEKEAESTSAPKRGVVQQLEEYAARGEEKRTRKPSSREQKWLERLVEKHGDNYKAMSRDVKLNPMQQSEGDIKARIRKWRDTTGTTS